MKHLRCLLVNIVWKYLDSMIRDKNWEYVTNKKNDRVTVNITKEWLNKYHKQYLCGTYLLDTKKTYDNVASFKAKIIQSNHITKHVEDNKQVLNRMNKILDKVQLYFWEQGMDKPIPYDLVQ